ncbi:MAG TPA: NAD-dependent epimerase/dehydratase family protein [Candidatus Didemnitutus sp.]|nr:NAD-dependent epimerase/dehydratase family protein [Candidatus Didemnitutus sp.]
MSHYLVTGAAGFIAARTCELLLDAGHTVAACDNLNDYYDVRLKRHRLERLQARTGFSFRVADIEDVKALDEVFAGRPPAAVINLAARAGVRPSIEQPEPYVATNVAGTLRVLEAMRRHGVKKLVLASSSSLYAGQAMPFVETLPVNSPLSPYAATKKAAEMLAASYHHLHGIDCSILRYFTVYGPGGRPDMAVLRFCRWIDEGRPIQLLGDGSQSRDFTYIDDIARGTIAALRPLGYEIINLGGGRNPIAMTEVIAKLENLLGRKANLARQPAHPADLPATWADIEKAHRLLDWKPEVDLDTGLRRTVDWYRRNRDMVLQLAM